MQDETINLSYGERRIRLLDFFSTHSDWSNRAIIGKHLGQNGWQNEETNMLLDQLVSEGVLETETREIEDTFYRGGKRGNVPTYPVFRKISP